jgi:CheY-like chemotaxis protein
MNPELDPGLRQHRDALTRATSDLNNALQTISVTASLIDNAWRGGDRSDEYLAMLRTGIARAEQVAADFVRQTGGPGERMLMHPQLAGAPKQPAALWDPSERSILVVDDDLTTLVLMRRLLMEAGYRVVAAQSGFECLDLFRSTPYTYDLVILDMTMPLLDGEETFHRLRAIRSDIPVILCAGFIQQEKLDRMMSSGLAGLLRKPVAPGEIAEHVRATLESLKYSPPPAETTGT